MATALFSAPGTTPPARTFVKAFTRVGQVALFLLEAWGVGLLKGEAAGAKHGKPVVVLRWTRCALGRHLSDRPDMGVKVRER